MFQLHIQGRDNVAFKIGNQTVLDTNGLGGIQLDSDDGALTTSSTFDSRDVAADGVTADAALPRTGGIMTGVISGFESTGIDDNATSTAITIDVNDNVGIGVVPESGWGSTAEALQLGTSFGALWSINGGSNTFLSRNVYYDGSYKYMNASSDEAQALTLGNDGSYIFRQAVAGTAGNTISWTAAMAIDNSGSVRVGSNSSGRVNSLYGLQVNSTASTAYNIISYSVDSSTHVHANFRRADDNQTMGTIQTNGSTTNYNTSSDYRLKENVTPMSGATAQTKLLKPCNFDWIVGGNVNGFIAHELAEVVPEAVTGTKDAMMDEEYEVTPATDTEEAVMGTRSVPDMQGIDQSKLVPLLTATIQELIARIEALEAG